MTTEEKKKKIDHKVKSSVGMLDKRYYDTENILIAFFPGSVPTEDVDEHGKRIYKSVDDKPGTILFKDKNRNVNVFLTAHQLLEILLPAIDENELRLKAWYKMEGEK